MIRGPDNQVYALGTVQELHHGRALRSATPAAWSHLVAAAERCRATGWGARRPVLRAKDGLHSLTAISMTSMRPHAALATPRGRALSICTVAPRLRRRDGLEGKRFKLRQSRGGLIRTC